MIGSTWARLLKNISLICNGIVFIVALIFLFGPRIFVTLNRFFDKYHNTSEMEKLLFSKLRIALGVILLISAFLMLFIVMKIKI